MKQATAKRAVITGIGVISPLGFGRNAFRQSLLGGQSGISAIEGFDTSPYPCKLGAEVKNFKAEDFLGKKGLRSLTRGTRMLASAIKLALDDAGLVIDDKLGEKTGVMIGSGFANYPQTTDYLINILQRGPDDLLPMDSYDVALNSMTSIVSLHFKLQPLARTISSGFASSADAIGNALDMIRLGRAERVIAGGIEQISIDSYLVFLIRRMLAGCDGVSPEISAPYDERRNGFILGEGAYVLIVEEMDCALARAANAYAELAGYATTFIRTGTNPQEATKKLARAIRSALADGQTSSSDIKLLSASANSSRELDLLEAQAINEVFGEPTAQPPVTALKSMTGECYGASGAMQAVAAAIAIEEGALPPTINSELLDAGCQINLLKAQMKGEIGAALINSFDVSGASSAIVLKRAS